MTYQEQLSEIIKYINQLEEKNSQLVEENFQLKEDNRIFRHHQFLLESKYGKVESWMEFEIDLKNIIK